MLCYYCYFVFARLLHISTVHLTITGYFCTLIVSLRSHSRHVGTVFGWFSLDFLYWARNFQRQIESAWLIDQNTGR